MIKELTKEQEEYLPVYRKKILDIACGGKRIDRKKLQDAINDAYALIDKEPPMLLILQSPMQANMAINLMRSISDLGGGVQDQLSSQLDEQLESQLWSQLRSQLWLQLDEQLESQLWLQLGSQLSSQLRLKLRSQLWSQLRSQLWSQLGPQLRSQLDSQLSSQSNGTSLCGSQDLYWIAFYKFCEDIGVNYSAEETHALDINYRIAEQCEWWWPYEGICFVSEKPVSVSWDDEGRLHGEDKPSVEYADGYSLWSWHGVSVPEEWIKDKSSITAQMALTWENMEQRRAACEIVGWNNVIEQLNPRVIDTNPNPQIGQLVEVEFPDIGTERFLRVECGTGREFALCVTRFGYDTAKECNAATYGWTPEQDINNFIPVHRT